MEVSVNYNNNMKIVCLTEESVETLFAIKKGDLIHGVSSYVKRPQEARSLPKVSLFTSSQIDKILAIDPDLVLGFSDIQKDVAKELIAQGVDVWIANHRSLTGIMEYIQKLGFLVGAQVETMHFLGELEQKMSVAKLSGQELKRRPKVYFEEWDDPMIGNIRWVSELIELCGGIDINKDKSKGKLAKERFVSSDEIIAKNPDIIFLCWCGKRARIEELKSRPGWDQIEAVKNNRVYELEPEIFLQPGPAPIIDGTTILKEHFELWQN